MIFLSKTLLSFYESGSDLFFFEKVISWFLLDHLYNYYEESINSSETDNSNKNHYRYESSSGSSVDPLTQIAGVGFDANFDPFLDYGFDNDNEANEWKAVLLSLNNSAVAKINNLRPTVIKPDGSDVTERINRSRSSDNIQEQGLQRSRSSASLLI